MDPEIKELFEDIYNATNFQKAYYGCKQLKTFDMTYIVYLEYERCEGFLYFTFPATLDVFRWSLDSNKISRIRNRHVLIAGEPSTIRGVRLLANASKKIRYILYPFKQNDVLPVNCLRPDNHRLLNEASLVKHYSSSSAEEHCFHWNGYDIQMSHDQPFVIRKNGVILSGFTDAQSDFQLGDASTSAYIIDDRQLLVYHHGDVCSAIIVNLM